MRYQFGGFELDDRVRELRRDGAPVPLSPRQFDVLLYLVRNRDRLVGKGELLATFWSDGARSESTLPTCISALRRGLHDDPRAPQAILTRYARGYRFAAPVREVAAAGLRTFVGRERELDELAARLKDARDGRGSVLLVSGEAGIGKSRLLDEARLLARSHGVLAIRSHCSEVQGAPAFWPWVQILRGYIAARSAQEVRRAIGDGAAHLARIVPEIGGIVPVPALRPISPASARYVMFESVVSTLRSGAEQEPLALLIDDVHGVDEASLELLENLVTRVGAFPMVVAASFRSAELELSSWRRAAVARIARSSATRSIELRGLADEEVASLVRASLGRGPSPTALRALVDQTAGNPFFLTHLLHHLKLAGEEALERESWHSALPRSVQEAIRRHVEALPEETRAALALAAVAGRHFSLAVLVRAAALPPERLRDVLGPALAAGVLLESEAGAFSFAHILLRDAIYEALPAPTGKALHGRVLSALEEIHGAGGEGPQLSEMAHHAREALGGAECRRAVAYSVRAARWASATLAYEEAAHQYENALRAAELADPVDRGERAELLIGSGDALIRANQRDLGERKLREAMAIARDLRDADRLARASVACGSGFFAIEAGVVDHHRISALEEALIGLAPASAALRSQVLANLALALYWTDSSERRRALVAEAVALAERAAEPRALAFALTAQEVALWDPSHPERRIAVAEHAIRLAEECGDREMELVYRLYRLTNLVQLGRLAEWDREIDVFSRKAEQLRQPQALWFSNLFKAVRALMQGAWQQARELGGAFREQGRIAADRNAEQCFVIHQALLTWETGDGLAAVGPVLEKAAEYPAILSYRCVAAALYAHGGQPGLARQLVAELMTPRLEGIPRNVHWLACACMLSEACTELGDRERARHLYEALLEFDTQVAVGAYCVGLWRPISYHLGRLARTAGDLGAAETHARQALEESAAAQSPPWVAHARLALAELLRERGRRGDETEVRELASRASLAARELGMPGLLRRLEAFVSRS